MIYVYLFSILAARVVQAVFSKLSSNEANNIVLTVKYTAYQYSVSAALGLILLLADMSNLKIDLPTLGIALLSGVSLFFSTFFSIYGMKSGTVSLVSMFGTAGLLVPIIAGVFLFGQPVSILQGVGTAIFFVSAWLLIKNSKNTYNGFSLKTLLLLIGAMLANGLTMLAQQMYTYYVPNGSISLFSFLSFGSVAAAGLPTAFATSFKSSLLYFSDLPMANAVGSPAAATDPNDRNENRLYAAVRHIIGIHLLREHCKPVCKHCSYEQKKCLKAEAVICIF